MDNNQNAGTQIEIIAQGITQDITKGMRARAYSASNELRNSSQMVLRGRRNGNEYIVPGTGRMTYYKRSKTAKITYKRYRASAPGEPPAVRTGAFRASWQPETEILPNSSGMVVKSAITSRIYTDNGKYRLGQVLEEGTSRMAPRPYKEKIVKNALPKIKQIYNRPYT